MLAVADEYRADIDYSMFLDSSRPSADQLREFGGAVHDTLHGATRRQVQLDRAMQAYLLRHPGARRRHREHLTAVAEAGGAWLEALAEQRGTSLPLPGPRFVQLLNALARGLMESALHDPTLLDETYFADSFALLDPDIHLRS